MEEKIAFLGTDVWKIESLKNQVSFLEVSYLYFLYNLITVTSMLQMLKTFMNMLWDITMVQMKMAHL